MAEIKPLGEINVKLLDSEFTGITTPEIIITNERLEHIKNHHPEDFELFQEFGKECVEYPDFIIKDSKHEETIFMVKKLENTNLNAVVKVVLDIEKPNLKNSVMTFYRIREKNLKKLLKKCKVLYVKNEI